MASKYSFRGVADMSQHDSAIKKSASEIYKYQKQVQESERQLNKFKRESQTTAGAIKNFTASFKTGNVDQLTTSLTAMGGKLLKLGGWFGVAMGAGEAFDRTIKGCQGTSDEYARIQASVTTVVDNFFSSLSSGDFSPFLNGMDSMIEKAREAYNEMDDLWNMAQSFGVQNTRLNNQFQKNLNEIRLKKDSKDPNDKKRVQELKQQNEGIIKKQSEGGVKLYNQTIKGLQAEIMAGTGMNSRITEGAIYRIVENDINNLKDGRKRYEKQFKEYTDSVDKLRKKHQKVGGGLIGKVANAINPNDNLGTEYQKELNKLQNKYGEAIAANYLLQKKSDDELSEFNNKLKQGLAYQNTAISNQSKMIRYDKETPTNKSTNNGGGGGGKKNEVQYTLNSVGELENRISQLQKQIKLQVDAEEIQKLKQLIKETQDQLELLTNPQTIKIKELSPMSVLSDKPTAPTTIDKDYSPSTIYAETQDKIDNVMQMYNIGVIGADKAKEFIDSFNAQLQSLGLKPIQVDIEANTEKVASSISEIGSAFQDLGSAMQMPEFNIMGTIAQAIANVVLGFAEAQKSPANTVGGVFTWVGAALTGLATMTSIIASIKSATAYAEGGIINGRTSIGDFNIARVNNGEMILNQRQQSHLFNLIDDNRPTSNVTVNGEWKLKGQDLYMSMKNYGKGQSKLGKNIGIK